MECPNGCSLPMKKRKIDKIFYRNSEPIIISDLTVNICPTCEHESIPLSSAKIIEKVLNGKVEPSGRFNALMYQGNDIAKAV